jgi:hypothetical protein
MSSRFAKDEHNDRPLHSNVALEMDASVERLFIGGLIVNISSTGVGLAS